MAEGALAREVASLLEQTLGPCVLLHARRSRFQPRGFGGGEIAWPEGAVGV
jgi:hypothetical protein